MPAQHWADAAAQRIVSRRGSADAYVLAAGISPSGTIHIGGFREVVTPELVARALDRLGHRVRFIFFWDDYDQLQRAPANLPRGTDLEAHLGQPLNAVPDPFAEASSYAEHFRAEFEASMPGLGVVPEYTSQAALYESGTYADGVRRALGARAALREILNEFRAQPLKSEWWPIEVYCACGAGAHGTTARGWDGADTVTYSCVACGRERVANLSRGGGVKLGWRIDWPMRWAHHGVDFEAAGKDHHTAGGAWETGVRVARDVFEIEPPETVKFDWINVRGVGTMASSTGQLISVADTLATYQPEVVRYLFARARPDREFELSFDLDVVKTYEDYDRAGRVFRGEEEANEARRAREGRSYQLAEVDNDRALLEPVAIRFRHLTNLLQIRDGDIDATLADIGDVTDNARRKLLRRAECAWYWILNHAPEGFRFRLKPASGPPTEVSRELIAVVAALRDHLQASGGADAAWLTQEIYDLAAAHGVEPKRLFRELYQVLIGKDRGPRLADFIMAIGPDRIDPLLRNVIAA